MFQLITKQLPFRCPNHFQVIARPSTSHEGHKGRPCLTTGPLDLRGQLWHSATLPMASQHLRKEPYGAKLGVSGNGEKTPRTTVLTKNMMINRQFSGYPILRETGSSSIQMIEILGTIWIEIWILAKISYIYIYDIWLIWLLVQYQQNSQNWGPKRDQSSVGFPLESWPNGMTLMTLEGWLKLL